MQVPTSKSLLFVTARGASSLKNVQMFGKQDPYLKLWVGKSGSEVKTTVDVDGGSSATWTESFVFNIESIDPEEFLYLEVKNKNVIDTTSIGVGKVALKTFGASMRESRHTVYDSKGREAGTVMLEGRVERRGDNDRAMGEYGRNLLRLSTQGVPLSGGSLSLPAHGGGGGGGQGYPVTPDAPKQHGTCGVNDPYYSQHSGTSYTSSCSGPYGSSDDHHGYSTSSATMAPAAAPAGSVDNAPRSVPNALYYGDPAAPAVGATQQKPSHHHSATWGGGVGTSMSGGAYRGGPAGAGGRQQTMSLSWHKAPTPGTASPSTPSAPPSDRRFRAQADAPYRPTRLPAGWEEKFTPAGRPFYVDHRTQTTWWDRPI